ncbi:helix-turn-helix domain-containing protein [Amycolatopsis magusensis]|uniref:helix-turn-helix domain-containing protein n=1 Tax=Amycolatopsis magusensis TaxID=882444 RepID=UPI0037AA5756
MIDEFGAVLAAIGPRLRALRKREGDTLAAAAERTGISVSTLSRLESGVRTPTLALLLPLARAYRVALDDLVDPPPTGDPRLRPRPITRHGMTAIPLTTGQAELRAFKSLLPAGPVGVTPDPRSHQGYHWLYVLSGRLRVVLGPRDFTLAEGEAVEFDTRVPHWFGNAEPKAVEFLSVLSTSGERIQLKVRPEDFPQLAGPRGR